jgi:hypothetical protein
MKTFGQVKKGGNKMEEEKCQNLVNLFQSIFKFFPSLVFEDEFGCIVSREIKHKNVKIVFEISEVNEEEEFKDTIQKFPIEFHELKLKNGTSHYIIAFYFQDDVVGRCAVRIYIE